VYDCVGLPVESEYASPLTDTTYLRDIYNTSNTPIGPESWPTERRDVGWQ